MYISKLYEQKKPVLSLEVFPPKKAGTFDTIFSTLDEVSALQPDFISVTYGASGSAQVVEHCVEIASAIENNHHIPDLSHLTCVGATREKIAGIADTLHAEGIENILALRGDLPAGMTDESMEYRYAYELIEDLKLLGKFCVGAACYPEGHIEEMGSFENMAHMKKKQEAGADFFISQLFFSNDAFYRLRESAQKAGITKPISAGIMPILGRSQVERMIFLCGASLPSELIKLLHRYSHSEESLRKAGIEHAAKQAEELAKAGADGIHIYTMNQPDIAKSIMKTVRGEDR